MFNVYCKYILECIDHNTFLHFCDNKIEELKCKNALFFFFKIKAVYLLLKNSAIVLSNILIKANLKPISSRINYCETQWNVMFKQKITRFSIC